MTMPDNMNNKPAKTEFIVYAVLEHVNRGAAYTEAGQYQLALED